METEYTTERKMGITVTAVMRKWLYIAHSPIIMLNKHVIKYNLLLRINSRYRKYKESAHMACLSNPISQPSLTFPPSGSPLPAMRSATHRED
jgi:hypothetical protein